jgi:hypothetical protein
VSPRGPAQLSLDLRRCIVVPNHWSPAYHLEDESHRTFWPGELPCLFESIGDAVAFARARGREPEVPEETRTRWGAEAVAS